MFQDIICVFSMATLTLYCRPLYLVRLSSVWLQGRGLWKPGNTPAIVWLATLKVALQMCKC